MSFSADGQVVYSTSDSFNANGPGFGGSSSTIVSRSLDGGSHWQAPVTAEFDASTQLLNDKESVTADQLEANEAYVVWDRLRSPVSDANPSAFIHSIAPPADRPSSRARPTREPPGVRAGSSSIRVRWTRRSATRSSSRPPVRPGAC